MREQQTNRIAWVAGAPRGGVWLSRAKMLFCLLLAISVLLPAGTALAVSEAARSAALLPPETAYAQGNAALQEIVVESGTSGANSASADAPAATLLGDGILVTETTPASDAASEATAATFQMPVLVVCVGSAPDLTADVTAADAAGIAMRVAIAEDGGFNTEVPGTYLVTYTATEQDSGATATAVRTVTVLSTEDYAAYINADNLKHHAEFVKLRKQCYLALSAEKETLTAMMREHIAAFLRENGLRADTVLRMRSSDSAKEEIVDSYTIRNWADVVTVFIATRCYKINAPEKIFLLREEYSLGRMQETLLNMTELSIESGEDDELPSLRIVYRLVDDVLEKDGLNSKRTSRLKSMRKRSYQQYIHAVIGDDDLLVLSEAEEERILSRLPEGISALRERIVLCAYSLLGKVPYFIGGKYNERGWNGDWGTPAPDMSIESRTFGELKPYGLDCGGFVSWVFVNAARSGSTVDMLGSGSAKQWENSEALDWNKALPGDLVFFTVPGDGEINHVGVVVAASDGKLTVVHCSSNDGTVVEDDAAEAGFTMARRPYLFGEE